MATFAAVTMPAWSNADQTYITGQVVQIAVPQYGADVCSVMLDSVPMNYGLNCSEHWITFDCTWPQTRSEQAAAPIQMLRNALSTSTPVQLHVSDEGHLADRCHVTRIILENTPYSDIDSDGDGVADLEDDVPLDSTETIDSDDDGTGDTTDLDDDNDGVNDLEDAFPYDTAETRDSDGGGLGDNADADDDNDHVPDSLDAFPLDPDESGDVDQDGIGDRADTDDDGDGIADIDTDGDGIGDNVDSDDDGDGVPDTADAFPTGHRDFRLAAGIGDATSIVFHEGVFHIIDETDRVAYAYDLAGQRVLDGDLAFDSSNTDPVGIAAGNGIIYVGDRTRRKVFAYDQAGRPRAEDDIQLANEQTAIKALAFAHDRLYVADPSHVRAYTPSGQRDAVLDFALTGIRRDRVVGLAYVEDPHGGVFYVTTSVSTGGASSWRGAAHPVDDDHYLFDLTREPPEALNGPRGVAIVNDKLFVVDGGPAKIRAYERLAVPAQGSRLRQGHRRPPRVREADLHLEPENSAPGGIAYINDRFYVLDGRQPRIFVYDARGNLDASGSVVLDPSVYANRYYGLAYTGDRFFTVVHHPGDEGFQQVVAYSKTGAVDHHRGFYLAADEPTSAYGLSYRNSRFYVVGCSPCRSNRQIKVFAYSETGDRQEAFDFNLHPDDRWSWGIASHQGRFHVGVNRAEPPQAAVSAYTSAGKRIASLDFDLHPTTPATYPRGMTVADDAFYVVGGRNSGPGGVFAYATQACKRWFHKTGSLLGTAVVWIHRGPVTSVWRAHDCTQKAHSPSVDRRDAITLIRVRVTHHDPRPPDVHASIGARQLPIEAQRTVRSENDAHTTTTTFRTDRTPSRAGGHVRFSTDPRIDVDSDYVEYLDIPI